MAQQYTLEAFYALPKEQQMAIMQQVLAARQQESTGDGLYKKGAGYAGKVAGQKAREWVANQLGYGEADKTQAISDLMNGGEASAEAGQMINSGGEMVDAFANEGMVDAFDSGAQGLEMFDLADGAAEAGANAGAEAGADAAAGTPYGGYASTAAALYGAYKTLTSDSAKNIYGGNADRGDYARTAYDAAATGMAFVPGVGWVVSAAMQTPIARKGFEKFGVKPLTKDNKEGYTDVGLNSTGVTSWVNPLLKAFGQKSVGQMLFGKHKDIYMRDQLREALRGSKITDEQNMLDINGTKFDTSQEVGYGAGGRLQNKGTESAISLDPNSYAGKAFAEGRNWRGAYDVDLTDKDAIDEANDLGWLGYGVAGNWGSQNKAMTGMLTNALMGSGLDNEGRDKWRTDFVNQQVEKSGGDRQGFHDAVWSGIDKADDLGAFEELVLKSKATKDVMGNAPTNPFGAGNISEAHRQAFVDDTMKAMKERGMAVTGDILDKDGFIVNADARTIHGVDQDTAAMENLKARGLI